MKEQIKFEQFGLWTKVALVYIWISLGLSAAMLAFLALVALLVMF